MYYRLHIFGRTLLVKTARYRFANATIFYCMYITIGRHQWQEVVPLTVGTVK